MRTNLNVNCMNWLKLLRPSCTTAVNTKSTRPYQLWLSGHLVRFPELCTHSIQHQMLRNGGDCPSSPRRQSAEPRARCSELSRFIFGVEDQHDLDPNTYHLFSQEGLLSPQKPPPKSSPLSIHVFCIESEFNLPYNSQIFFPHPNKGVSVPRLLYQFHIHT